MLQSFGTSSLLSGEYGSTQHKQQRYTQTQMNVNLTAARAHNTTIYNELREIRKSNGGT